MRVVKEIPHPEIKITVFYWNNKYLVKLEQGLLEQTFKVSEMDVTSDDDIQIMLDENFMQSALARFKDMQQSLEMALGNI
jgi:predicted secreted protein